MTDFNIKMGYIPGAIGRVAELHGTYYHKNWTFGLFFEAKVAMELSEFLKRYDEDRDGFWTISVHGRVEGAIAIDGIQADRDGAHLRWFIMSDSLRGEGAGKQLIKHAVDFCRKKNYQKIYLWTFEGLEPARHLYEKTGFKLIKQQKGEQWGTVVNEQRYELVLE